MSQNSAESRASTLRDPGNNSQREDSSLHLGASRWEGKYSGKGLERRGKLEECLYPAIGSVSSFVPGQFRLP